MKNVNKLAVLLGLAALVAPALQAEEPRGRPTSTSCRPKDAGVPVPGRWWSPQPSRSEFMPGTTAELAFTVDAQGSTVSGFSVNVRLGRHAAQSRACWTRSDAAGSSGPPVSGGVAVATSGSRSSRCTIAEAPVLGAPLSRSK